MTPADTTIKRAVRELCGRQLAAFDKLVEYVTERGFSTDEATKIARLYVKEKIVKLDAVDGRPYVKHGAFYNKDCLSRALASCK
jgi:hypothetical protein